MNTLPKVIIPSAFISLFRGQVHLRIDDIVRLEADRNYTRFVLVTGKVILTSKNISYYEALLPPFFLRVNKSYLLNRTYLLKIHKGNAQMNDGFCTQVSRRKRTLFNKHSITNLR